ncbi:MAG: T9SS type A sorting domain-containing protein [Bacteroidaceae bacterium]|nr:T9SS type A sorting domain-containing protein [Bacteroidaceae bacterium]
MNKILFKSLSALLLTLASTIAYSQEREILHVWMNNGLETALMLSTHPVVSFTMDKMVITTNLQTIELPVNQVSRFTYSFEEISAIHDKDLKLYRDGDLLFFPEGTTIDHVSVYTTDGRLLSVNLTNHGQRTILDLTSLPKGVYIVKAQNKTLKITRQ